MHQGDQSSPSKWLLLDMHCETKCQQRIHGGYESIAVNICNLLIFETTERIKASEIIFPHLRIADSE